MFPKLHPLRYYWVYFKKKKKLHGQTDWGNAIHTESILFLDIHNAKGKAQSRPVPVFLLQAAQAQSLPDQSGGISETYLDVLDLLPTTQPSSFVEGIVCNT